ncbi:MAG: hypothetical protein M4579_007229 [Chaenotheca gracillima]|nr:MAG: hypothetical protein M4579_007229 [Chaenotheca gracillima]
MPEIGEIARLVHYLKKHLLGKTLAAVRVQEDNIVYGKAGTSAEEFQKAITGKKVVDVGQQGKYFWMIMSSPPHPLLHCSMTGWFKFSNDDSAYYKPTKAEDESWPPRFWKFILETKEDPKCEAAFVDPRRLGRIRLVDCEGDKIRQVAPLNQNGPDPVIDKDQLTEEWLGEKLRSKRVPVKAFLLDQSIISGVGNWVADEILYNAKIHPEQYTNSLGDAQLAQLHKSLMYICGLAVETLADSSKFPEEWLMKHRWGKGKKSNTLPNGAKITHITVGGRTSAVVPSVQKKTGPVAGDVKSEDDEDEDEDEDEDVKPKASKPKAKAKKSQAGTAKESKTAATKKRGKSKEEEVEPKAELKEEDEGLAAPSPAKRRKTAPASTGQTANGTSNNKASEKTKNANQTKKTVQSTTDSQSGRRRSARIEKK